MKLVNDFVWKYAAINDVGAIIPKHPLILFTVNRIHACLSRKNHLHIIQTPVFLFFPNCPPGRSL